VKIIMHLKIDIDDALMNEAFACSKAKTVEELIHEALAEFIRIRKRKDLTELAGRIQPTKDYDHKALRKLRGGFSFPPGQRL
jgi:Arc/MetJ family transcription regulator